MKRNLGGKRERAAILTVCALAGILLSGCGAGKGTDTKLTVWTNMNVEDDPIQKYADEWGAANGYEVEVIHQSPSVQQFAQAITSPHGPDAVIGSPHAQLADYVKAG